MHRIDTDTAVAVLPASDPAGAPGYFTKGNPGPGTPVPATNLSQDWCNAMQEEIIGVLAAAGVAPSKANNAQLITAIKSLIQSSAGSYLTDAGAANAYVITPSPAITAYAGGQKFLMIAANANTGASTVNVSGLGVKSIVLANGDALRPGDIPAGGLTTIIYQATLGKFILGAPATPAYSTSSSGYMRVPGTPFILQWTGTTSPAGAGSGVGLPTGLQWYNIGNIAFPIAFPNACLFVQGSAEVTTDTYTWNFQGSKNAIAWTSVYLVRNTNVTNAATPLFVFAIGW